MRVFDDNILFQIDDKEKKKKTLVDCRSPNHLETLKRSHDEGRRMFSKRIK